MSGAGAVSLRGAPPRAAAEPARSHRDRRLRAVVAVGVAAGVALRVAFLVLPGTGALDADEAVTGLMALHALRDGEVTAFFWGQAYGGSLEPLLAVPVVAVLGASTLAVKAVPMALSAVAALLVWRVGRRTVGDRAGIAAGLALWVWPAVMVWFSTKGRGFYWVCLVAGLTVLLLALRLARAPGSRLEWSALGLAAGIGWWSSPQILYFALPAAVWLLASLRRDAWRAVIAVPAAVVGAAPWLAFNAANGWASLQVGDHTHDEGVLGNLRVLATEGLPTILGLRLSFGAHWLVQLAVVALVVGVVVAAVRRPDGTGLLLVGAATFPVVYALLPVSGVVGEGRYLLFALPYLALLVAHAARTWGRQVAFVAIALALSVAGVPKLEGGTAPRAVDVLVPSDLGPVLEVLEARDVEAVLADYWVAYRIAYETEERITAAPISDLRHPDAMEEVLRSDGPAWVFVEGTYLLAPFEAELARRGVTWDREAAGGFVVYLPHERVVCWPTDPQVGVPCG